MSIDWNWLRWALALGSCGGPDGDGQGPDGLDPVPSGETGDALHSAAPPGGSGATGGTGHTASGVHTGTPTTWPQFAHCGPLVFAGQAGGSGADGAGALAVTPDGVVMTGSFVGTATFGAGVQAVASGGFADGFVARYADDGTVLWVRVQATAQSSATTAVGFDPSRGRTVGAGFFNTDLTIDGGGVQLVLVEEDWDGWVAAWDAAGTAEWATAIGSVAGNEEIEDLAFGPDGEVYVVGTTEGDDLHATGGPSSIRVDAVGLTAGVLNGFLLRIEPDGTPAWFRTFSGAITTTTSEVEVAADDVYVGTSFAQEVWVDRTGPGERTYVAPNFAGVLVTRWSGEGALVDGFVLGPSTGGNPARLQALEAEPTGLSLAGDFGADTTWGGSSPGAVTVAVTEATVGRLGRDGAYVGPLTQVAGSPDYTAVRPATLDDDGTGTLALAGYQTGLFTWAPGTAREAVIDVGPLDPEGLFPSEPVLVTYAPDGSLDCLWHLDAMASGNRAYQAAFDGRGGVWVVGTFSYTFVVNEGTPSAVTLDTVPEGAGTHHEGDAFLARFLLRPP